jgi:DNA-binding SARP family transcriptional activator
MGNPTELYLPLLAHADPDVRRHAVTLLLATFGERGLTYLRRLLDSPVPEVRAQARAALLAVAEIAGLHVELRPFRGIYIRCLGELKVFINSHEMQPADWGGDDGGRAGGRKVQGLFAFLVHRGHHGATRAEMAAAVWETPVSPASVSRTLGALRQSIARAGSPDVAGQALAITRDRVALNPAAYFCDADHLERTFDLACQREEQAGLAEAQPLYRQVLALYDGPYMEALPRGSDWGQERRDQIAGAFVIAAERLAEHAFAHGNDRQCAQICRQALAVDPADDGAAAWLLRAYARMGLRVDLENAYVAYLDAAGVVPLRHPDDPVVALYPALRAHEPPLALHAEP